MGHHQYRYLVTTNKTTAKEVMHNWRSKGYGARYIDGSVYITIAKMK